MIWPIREPQTVFKIIEKQLKIEIFLNFTCVSTYYGYALCIMQGETSPCEEPSKRGYNAELNKKCYLFTFTGILAVIKGSNGTDKTEKHWRRSISEA